MVGRTDGGADVRGAPDRGRRPHPLRGPAARDPLRGVGAHRAAHRRPPLEHGRPLAAPGRRGRLARRARRRSAVVVRTGDLDAALRADHLDGVELLVPRELEALAGDGSATADADDAGIDWSMELSGRTVVVAGHDLKFARPAHRGARGRAAPRCSSTSGSRTASTTRSGPSSCSARADVVLCEWGLGNAVWYSQHVRPDQRLVVRVHSQELRRPHLARIKHSAVARVRLRRRARARGRASRATESRAARPSSCPTRSTSTALDRDKHPGAERTLGLVGIVPRHEAAGPRPRRPRGAPRAGRRLPPARSRAAPRRTTRGCSTARTRWPSTTSSTRASSGSMPRTRAAVRFDGHGDDMPRVVPRHRDRPVGQRLRVLPPDDRRRRRIRSAARPARLARVRPRLPPRVDRRLGRRSSSTGSSPTHATLRPTAPSRGIGLRPTTSSGTSSTSCTTCARGRAMTQTCTLVVDTTSSNRVTERTRG